MDRMRYRRACLPFSAAVALWIAAVLLWAGSAGAAEPAAQVLFATPEAAVQALADAAKAKDQAAVDRIFGPAGAELRSGDEVQDAAEMADMAVHMAEKTAIKKEGDAKAILQIGNENWPFPIPLVRKGDQWLFDTKAGREEILNRRVGENELTAILVCRSYVKAQREYVLKDWDGDGDGILAYAQKLRSDKGKRNGLFWRSKPGEEVSPLGELVARAWHEGYKKQKAAFKEDAPSPFHGYYFRILTRQGKNAPGGKYNYIVNGNMLAGFALIAYPANWGKSGVMTFIVNQQGKVYEKNLGPDTVRVAERRHRYNPDVTWRPVKD
jgi:hypothetical protein